MQFETTPALLKQEFGVLMILFRRSGLWYSTFATRLVSPPVATRVRSGTGTERIPRRGFVGSIGTVVPSGFTSGMLLLLSRKPYGESERTSKPRMSLSPPI